MGLAMTDRNRNPDYVPDRGFIGRREVRVANYLFQAGTGQGHPHARKLVDSFLRRPASEHHRNSRRLTRFLESRGMTFRKSVKGGEQKTFPVPVTTSIVPLPRSQFDRLSAAAAVLVYTMRRILQEIYGSAHPAESPFIKGLSGSERERFLKSILESPHYIPQLHHPMMRGYPFFDQVGLDLVLVEDYGNGEGGLPFRLLEINAGSPSGASNNNVLLEGLRATDPDLLDSLGPLCENDHFDALRSTYRSLGESWTGCMEGASILLPPGGSNAAAPEIHSLSTYSGLTICEAAHLYQDEKGWIRMRSVDGTDPVVTSIYSRVNSDSVLFDPEKGILLRDPESGEPLYCRDPLAHAKGGSGESIVRDSRGDPIPIESVFKIPGALEAIHNKKLYVGGLNRLLDNKLLLDVLTRHAPLFYRDELKSIGLDPLSSCLLPPESLTPGPESVGLLRKSPEEWVVKSPHLSGGTGVHVLMALPRRERSRVLKAVGDSPTSFAYQKMVRIGRIPVSMKSSAGEQYRLANLAADLRMWVLFGGEGSIPRMTRNALVRFAPVEKGALSSTVNTSKGGGYAPFVIVSDRCDLKKNQSVNPLLPVPVEQLPVFAAAQLIQILRMIGLLKAELERPSPSAYRIYGILLGLSLQIKEVAAFLDPRAAEVVHAWLKRVESKIDRRAIAGYFSSANRFRALWVSASPKLEESGLEFVSLFKKIGILSSPEVYTGVRTGLNQKDEELLKRISLHPEARGWVRKSLLPSLRRLVRTPCPDRVITRLEARRMRKLLTHFEAGSRTRWSESPGLSWLNQGGALEGLESRPVHVETPPAESATGQEFMTGRLIFETMRLPDWVLEARFAWLGAEAGYLTDTDQERIEKKRESHFERFPRLRILQSLIDRPSGGTPGDLLQLLEVLPYARFNLERYSVAIGVETVDLFSEKLVPGRIARLECPEWKGSGACFVRKSTRSPELLESQCYIWVSKDQSPICQAYTVGHEVHHALQYDEIRSAEKQARARGPAEVARFMNGYGNFFGLDSGPSVESAKNGRTVLYGLQDRMFGEFDTPVIREIRESLVEGTEAYEKTLARYGSAFASMMPASATTRVKALREVYPALENLRNLMFAEGCGLRIPVDPVGTAIPVANRIQRELHRNCLLSSITKARMEGEVLRVVASNQLYGVGFGPEVVEDGRLVLRIDPAPIDPAKAYHQSQQ